jgi:hypothetical protein
VEKPFNPESRRIQVKLSTQTRVHWHFPYHLDRHGFATMCHRLTRLLDFDFGRYAIALPNTVWRCLLLNSRPELLAGTLFLGTAVFFYLRHTVPQKNLIGSSEALLLCASGVLVSAIGMVFSFAGFAGDLTTTGDNNRVAIVAAIGAAAVLIGGSSIVSLWIGGRHRTSTFATIVAVVCACNYLVVSTIASFWVEASHRQTQVLAAVRSALPRLPVSGTVLVGGFCSYEGPAVVFETTWDMSGILRIAYSDPTANADVVNRQTTYNGGEITTRSYDENVYTVGHPLVLVDVAERTAHVLSNAEDVRRYLAPMLLMDQCPVAKPGEGASIF